MPGIRLVFVLAVASVLLTAPSLARANTPLVVTKTADTNDGACNMDCSLREAITAANTAAGDDTISLPASLYTLNRTGAGENLNDTGDLDIANNGSVTITGAGARTTTINGNATDRVFDVLSGATLSASGLTITNGKVGTTENGGGVRNNGSVTLTDAAVSGNVAGDASSCNSVGGGIANDATALVLTRVAVLGNQASCDGGGIDTDLGTFTATDSTIAGNAMLNVNAGGAGLDFDTGGAVQLTNDTVAFNTNTNAARPAGVFGSGSLTGSGLEDTIIAANTPADCAVGTPVTVSAPNLDSDSNCFTGSGAIHSTSPMLAAVANNGGPTDTVALLAGSPAIDRGDSSGETIDQRGLPRPVDFSGLANFAGGNGTDLGAFEVQQVCASQTDPASDFACAGSSGYLTQPPPTGSSPTGTAPTGQRATALKKCKHKRSKEKRKKCIKQAKKLPV
jgi:CSLREA domain-containing protein